MSVSARLAYQTDISQVSVCLRTARPTYKTAGLVYGHAKQCEGLPAVRLAGHVLLCVPLSKRAFVAWDHLGNLYLYDVDTMRV